MALTIGQQRSLVVMPKLAALPSMIGSFYIVIDFLFWKRKKKTKRAKKHNNSTITTYDRLLAGMSTYDIVTSFCYFLGTWPIPSDSGVLEASGNEQTCTTQAFFIQSGLAIPFYNLSLAIYYLLVVGCGWSERDITRKIEPFMHGLAILAGFGTSIASLALKLFDNSLLWCWISPSHDMYRWLFFYGPLWLCILGVTVLMIVLYRSVKKIEIKAQKWTKGGDKGLAKQVKWQALWYVGAFYWTWTFATASRITQAISGQIPFPLLIVFATTLPGQGMWNFLVYVRPRYLRYCKKHPEKRICTRLYRNIQKVTTRMFRTSTWCLTLPSHGKVDDTEVETGVGDGGNGDSQHVQQDTDVVATSIEVAKVEEDSGDDQLEDEDEDDGCYEFADNPASLLARIMRQKGHRNLVSSTEFIIEDYDDSSSSGSDEDEDGPEKKNTRTSWLHRKFYSLTIPGFAGNNNKKESGQEEDETSSIPPSNKFQSLPPIHLNVVMEDVEDDEEEEEKSALGQIMEEQDHDEENSITHWDLSLSSLRQPSLGYVLTNDSNRSMIPPPPPPADESPIRRPSVGLSGLRPAESHVVNDDGDPLSSAEDGSYDDSCPKMQG